MQFSIQVAIQKNGLIVVLYLCTKRGDNKSVDNNRGIALLSCVSKLFTSVVYGRIDSANNGGINILNQRFLRHLTRLSHCI